MSTSDEPRLNSVNRFRKQSARLVLEEHSHCEVPAGCGGVVLRWRNPLVALPVTVWLYTPVTVSCFLDGDELRTGRVELAPGPHVFAVHLENVNLSAALIAFAAVHGSDTVRTTTPAEGIEWALTVISAEDGTWKFTLDDPVGADWMARGYDDQSWLALVRVPPPRLQNQDFGSYRLEQCTRRGAACLGLPRSDKGEEPASWWARLFGGRAGQQNPPPVMGNIWIRKVIEVPVPRQRQ